jgi:hypothetical protein
LFKIRFIGAYDELDGGVFESSALCLSGGIHESFSIRKCRIVTAKLKGRQHIDPVEPDKYPSVDEIYHLIKIAIDADDLICCNASNVKLSKLKFNFDFKNKFYFFFRCLIRFIAQMSMKC